MQFIPGISTQASSPLPQLITNNYVYRAKQDLAKMTVYNKRTQRERERERKELPIKEMMVFLFKQ
jgi:hypothetical protein